MRTSVGAPAGEQLEEHLKQLFVEKHFAETGVVMKFCVRMTLVCLLLSPAASNAANPLAGIWIAVPSWCAFKNQIGDHFPAPIKITQYQVIGIENTCTIERMDKLAPKNAWAVTLNCSGEGEEYRDDKLFMIDSAGQLHQFGDGFLVTFVRCK